MLYSVLVIILDYIIMNIEFRHDYITKGLACLSIFRTVMLVGVYHSRNKYPTIQLGIVRCLNLDLYFFILFAFYETCRPKKSPRKESSVKKEPAQPITLKLEIPNPGVFKEMITELLQEFQKSLSNLRQPKSDSPQSKSKKK